MFLSLLLTNRLVQGLAVVLILVAGFFTFRAVYKAEGREEVRVEQIERTLETARERIEVENDVRREPDPVERLREQWSRP
jgi:hypothetical protein